LSWDKFGKFLMGMLAVLAVLVGSFLAFRGDGKLQAYLSYDSLTYPSQFSARISTASEQLKYDVLYKRVQEISQGTLNQDQANRLVDLAQAPFRQMFAKPFEAGLVDHRTGLYIYLHNDRGQAVKDVHVRLPAKGLVQVRDEIGDDQIQAVPTNVIDVPMIMPGGAVRIWVYFEGDYSEIRQAGVAIRHADGLADIKVYRAFAGFQAKVAQYGIELVMLLGVLGACLLGCGYICLMQYRALLACQRPGRDQRER